MEYINKELIIQLKLTMENIDKIIQKMYFIYKEILKVKNITKTNKGLIYLKSRKLMAALLTVTMATSILAVGCGNKKDTDKNENNKKEEKKDDKENKDNAKEDKMDKEQYLNVVEVEPKTLDQSKSTDLYSSDVLTNVNEALTRVKSEKYGEEKNEPGAAESWKVSEDGLTWTFKLRDMKWQDGEKVKAQDFEYGIKRTLDAKTASNYAFLLYPIKNGEAYFEQKAKVEDVGVKALDDNTLEIKLEKKCPYFLKLTSFKVFQPQRKDFVEKLGDKYGTDADKMICCGPFLLKEWAHDNKIILEKNPDYWNAENVKLEKVNMKIIKDANSRMTELYNGNLDMCGADKPEWIEKLDKTGDYELLKGPAGSVSYTMFNQDNKYLKNAKIRKAFSIAVDREGVCKTLYHGIDEPATAWCPPKVSIADGKEFRELAGEGAIEKLIKENSDPKKLLQEGLKEINEDPDPSKHTFKLLTPGTSARFKEIGEYYQQNYKNVLGVNINVEYCEWATFQTRTKERDYELASLLWGGDYDDVNTFFDLFMTGNDIIHTGWPGNKEYDKLILEANNITDNPEERAKKIAEAEKILIYDEAVVSPEYWSNRNTYIRKYVKNYMPKVFGSADFSTAYTSGRE